MRIGLRLKEIQTRLLGLILLGVFASASSTSATVHIVLFGGALGEAYSPNSFSAFVGDTVRWEGDFGIHPLSSTTIPGGASSWHNDAGTTFDYVIMVPGTFNYQCDVHQPIMVGSFSAVLTGVEASGGGESPVTFRLQQNYPNPFNPATVIGYQLPAVSNVRLVVYDLLGQEVSVLVNQQQGAGIYQVRFDAAGLASGMYEYRLTARQIDGGQANSFVQSKRMLLTR